MVKNFKHLLGTVVVFLAFIPVYGQNSDSSIDVVIGMIERLESQKDAKCYATANRLEDFMYGTPLSEEARNVRIDIQKALVLFLKEECTKQARAKGLQSIDYETVVNTIDNIVVIGRLENKDFYIDLKDERILIKLVDFRQYSSVSYGYRSLLSVEQDLMIFNNDDYFPFSEEAIPMVYNFINFMTLASLQLSDREARTSGKTIINSEDLINGWYTLLDGIKQKGAINPDYPEFEAVELNTTNEVLEKIIEQKISSYNEYNQLNTSVFLRNIQVYFAKQIWPSEKAKSDELKNYLLESLIAFCDVLIKDAEQVAEQNNRSIIRLEDVQLALQRYTPFTANYFEDITFFPNYGSKAITIESYDLDAFRDSGIHWQILSYCLEDHKAEYQKEIDPNAAELIVEGLAQMGVLVLRLAGKESKAMGKDLLHLEDISFGFAEVQRRINGYQEVVIEDKAGAIVGNKTYGSKTAKTGFRDITQEAGINFMHKSSDWLSRYIRSYVVGDSNLIRLSIPPAFGGSGIAAGDVNNDGWDDILILGGFGNKLYINKGGKFSLSEASNILSVWSDSRTSYGEPRQPIIADFNNDGWQDIFISYVNAPHRLYQNMGAGSFKDVSDAAKLGGLGQVAGPATAFDYDNDGLLDIVIGYFGNYLDGKLPSLSRNNQNGDKNVLFKNMGDFSFKLMADPFSSGLNSGWTQAMGHTDINRDGLQDFIVGNDFGINEYYINNGDGTFDEMSGKLGTNKPSYTMNVGVGDLNRDSYPDLYISNIVVMQKDEKYVSPNENTTMKFDPDKMKTIRTVEANDLFLSRGDGLNYSLSTDIGRGYSATGWSWDADFFDYDNDGDDDLYVLNGMNDFAVYGTENPEYYNAEGSLSGVEYASSSKEKNVFFINDNGQLINKAKELNTDIISNSRSAAYLDYDNDGDLDIVINNYHGESVLLENLTAENNNWIKVKLEGDATQKVNKDGIGATILVSSENHKNLWREVHSTDGYLSVHPRTQHFGLGKDEIMDIKIIWPNGTTAIIEKVKCNKAYNIKYPNLVSIRQK
ncbi:MAG: CRTAC1 family protein [Saprospiraceae bacterium]|nr:CRTAC1 family protein [Saprospiraceae bacterium]